MVGAGQLARMSCQAAISLGIGFRVLAGSAGDSAAQVCADDPAGRLHPAGRPARLRRRVRRGHLRPRARARPHLTALERTAGGPAGRRRAPPPQDKLADARAADRARRCLPAFAPVADRRRGRGVRRGGRLAGGAQGGQRRLRRQGVWVCESAGRGGARSSATAVALLAEEYVGSTGSWPCWRPGRRTGRARSTRSCRPSSATAICRRGARPRARAGPRQAARGPAAGAADRDELGVTGLLAVELFELPAGRPAGQRAGHAPAQQRALDHRGRPHVAVRAAPAGRPGPARWATPRAAAPPVGDGQCARRHDPDVYDGATCT